MMAMYLKFNAYLYVIILNTMKKLLLLLVAVGAMAVANAQTMRESIAADPDLAAGIYTAYRVTDQVAPAAPRGYRPFYISHYGRHGSRYQTAPEKYSQPLEIFEKACKDGKLTALGLDALRRVRILADDAYLRAGDLSRRGEREQRGIAERMVMCYPQVFDGKGADHITCFASPSVRCVMSMAAFTERVKEFNPKLEFTRNASEHDIDITRPEKNMNVFYKQARVMAREYQQKNTEDRDFVSRLFNDYDYAEKLICSTYNTTSTYAFIGNMHDLAMIVQNFDDLPSLHDLFTESERYQMWKFFNIRRYLTYGPSADFGDIRNKDGQLLLRDIVERADKVISGETPNEAATLRFGHDSAVIPLLAVMQVEGCDGRVAFSEIEKLPEVWCDSRITSMSVNVQFIFYRNRKGDVLVRMMHSEKDVRIPLKSDIYPFYRWEDFRSYCLEQCR
jgi:hypothetical protein